MCRLNHPLAANRTMSWPDFGVQRPDGSLRQDVPGPRWNHLMAETASLEASVGREIEARLGHLREFLSTQISATQVTQKKLRENGWSTGRILRWWLIFVSRAVRNHPMAARVWRHQLAKTAIGWVE